MLKRHPRKLYWLLQANTDLRNKLKIANEGRPIGSGTRGIIFATSNPNIVVKVTEDKREMDVARRFKDLNLNCVVRIHASFAVKTMKRNGQVKNLIFTYLENLHPLDKLSHNAHEYFHGQMDKHKYSYHLPQTILTALHKEIDDLAPAKYVPHLARFRTMLYTILDAGEWHRDLKTPNLMLSKEGNLKITDIGSFTERPLVVNHEPLLTRSDIARKIYNFQRNGDHEDAKELMLIAMKNKDPLLLRSDVNELIERFERRASDSNEPKAHEDVKVIKKLAIMGFEAVDPEGGIDIPDPNHAEKDDVISSSELSESWLPEELVRVLRPDDGKWRVQDQARTVRPPYVTYDVTPERFRMNDDPRVRQTSQNLRGPFPNLK